MTKCVPYYLELLDAFVQDISEDFAPQSILDLGCGNGNVTARTATLFPKAQFTLVDASAEMLNLCENRFSAIEVDCIESYFSEFDFEENTFDYITAGFSLHHCPTEEKQELFSKIYRSLKPKGIFGYSDLMMHKSNPKHPKLLRTWKAFVTPSYPDDQKWEWLMEHYEAFDHPDDFTDQVTWLKQAGFLQLTYPFKEDCWAHIRAKKTSA